MEVFFECLTRRIEQEERNSTSTSNHVLFCLLYKHLTNKNGDFIDDSNKDWGLTTLRMMEKNVKSQMMKNFSV